MQAWEGVPVVETERLRLRGHRPEDLAECAALWADPAVTSFIGGQPFTREEVWARMMRYAGHWLWLRFGYWVVEERSTNRLVGEVGLADNRREIELAVQGVPELGWVVATKAAGRGYATEAARAALAWFESGFGAGGTFCLIAPGNTASIRVASKCGYREQRRTIYRGQPTMLFVRGDAPQIP